MQPIIIIFLFLLTIIFYFNENIKAIVFLVIVSIANDFFTFSQLGPSISIYHVIGLLYSRRFLKIIIHKNKNLLIYTINPLILEWLYLLFLGILFGILFPWETPYDSLRSWTSLAWGRGLVASIRFFSELSLVFFIYSKIVQKRITISEITKIISIIVILTVAIAIIDYFTGYPIYKSMIGESPPRIRFIALNGEPRAFGRSCAFFFVILLYFKESRNKISKIAMLIAFLGVLISLSATSFVILFLGITPTLFMKKTILKNFLFIILSVLTFSYILISLDNNNSEVTMKIRQVLFGEISEYYDQEVIPNEPVLFKRFEVFDRAALNFLYKNNIYVLTGVGPNLISIPASNYRTKNDTDTYGPTMVSVPFTLPINILSRSGLIGLFLFLLSFKRIRKILKTKSNNFKLYNFFLSIMLMSLITILPFFYLSIGLAIGLKSNELNGDYK